MRMQKSTLIIIAALAFAGCRGTQSSHPPVHLNLNMDYQERFNAQEANPFFADNRSMRMPVPGTVARGMLREDVAFYEGRTSGGTLVAELPVPTTRELLLRGQERYNIFCTPCHGQAGDGQGIITSGTYTYTPAPTFHSDRLREIEDGHLFDVISHGIRTMPAYGHQIPVADRWAIVSYVRALQRSQYARQEDVPSSIRAEIEQGATSPGAEPATDEDSPAGAPEGEGAPEGATGADTSAQGEAGNE